MTATASSAKSVPDAYTKHALLSHEQTLQLIAKAQRGSLTARNELVSVNMRLVVQLAYKAARGRHWIDVEDLIHDGVSGLIRAIEKYDPTTGYRLSTYATIWINSKLQRAIHNHHQRSPIRLPIAQSQMLATLMAKVGSDATPEQIAAKLDTTVDDAKAMLAARNVLSSDYQVLTTDGIVSGDRITDPADNTDTQALDNAEAAELQHALAQLTARERTIVTARYGLSPTPGTLHELAARFSTDELTILRTERTALAKLRTILEGTI